MGTLTGRIVDDLARRRLRNQRLVGAGFQKPDDVVQWLVAVQAQDYPAARWALGLRISGVARAGEGVAGWPAADP